MCGDIRRAYSTNESWHKCEWVVAKKEIRLCGGICWCLILREMRPVTSLLARKICTVVCCLVLQFITVCCSVQECVAVGWVCQQSWKDKSVYCSVLQCIAVFCRILQYVAVGYGSWLPRTTHSPPSHQLIYPPTHPPSYTATTDAYTRRNPNLDAATCDSWKMSPDAKRSILTSDSKGIAIQFLIFDRNRI